MTWKGNTPTIEMVEGKYDTGAKLTKAEMRNYEQRISTYLTSPKTREVLRRYQSGMCMTHIRRLWDDYFCPTA